MIGAAVTNRQFRANYRAAKLPASSSENICGYSSAPINSPAYDTITRRQVLAINGTLSYLLETRYWKNYRRSIFEVRFNPHWLIASCINVFRDIISLKKEPSP